MSMLMTCRNKLCDGVKNGMKTLTCNGSMKDCSEIGYTWAIEHQCQICDAKYYSCRLCANDTTMQNIFPKSRLARHNQMHHSKNESVRKQTQYKRKFDSVDESTVGDCNSDSVIGNDMFNREESFHYFSVDKKHGNGAYHLVANALFGTENVCGNISTDDVTLHLVIARFVKSLSRVQRVEFAFILEILLEQNKCNKCDGINNKDVERDQNELCILSKYSNATDEVKVMKEILIQDDQSMKPPAAPHPLKIITKLPITDADMRKCYLVGKRSITNNLPRPNIYLIDNHSYASVRECVAHFLAVGKLPHPIPTQAPTSCYLITDSAAAIAAQQRGYQVNSDVLRESVITLLAVQWSDAFDPNSSIKSNRGAVWIKTITFVSEHFQFNNPDDTFVLSIGLKGSNHDGIEKKFISELIELSTGINNLFYCAKLKRNVRVHLEIIASLGDQPERRENNYLAGGNSKFGARYMYAANLEELQDVLPPCESCLTKLQKEPNFIVTNKQYECCLKWDLTGNSKKAKYLPPPDYPKNLLPKDGKLQPIKLTFEVLNAVNEYSSTMLEAGEWSEKELTCYLMSNGISKLGCTQVIEHCHNKVTYDLHLDSLHKSDINLMKHDFLMNPKKYKHWTGGPYWKSKLMINQFIDVLMHLLFLGVTKSMREILLQWIGDTRRMSVYKKLAYGIFTEVAEMSLEWCKLLVSSSGWVSDNYVAFARVCKWFYYPITVLQDGDDYKEPEVILNKWDSIMCRNWLRAHGLDTNGNLKQLRERIEGCKSNKVAPPKLVEAKYCSKDSINQFIGSLLSMVSSVMRKCVTDASISHVDREIKIFLSYLNLLECKDEAKDDKSNKKTKKKIWLSRYNHMSLLNIPMHMKEYGPLVNLWEGSNQGEGYLRLAKPKLTNIHSKNWQINAHKEIYNEVALDQVLQLHIGKNYTNKNSCVMQNYINSRMNRPKKLCVRYKSVNEILSSYRRNRPISGVQCSNNKFFALVQRTQELVHGVEIKVRFLKSCDSLSMNFHNVELNDEMTDMELNIMDVDSITRYVLLLPELNKMGYNHISKNGSYYIIDSDWNELDVELNFIPPKAPNCAY